MYHASLLFTKLSLLDIGNVSITLHGNKSSCHYLTFVQISALTHNGLQRKMYFLRSDFFVTFSTQEYRSPFKKLF